jgi:hypothetical protein
MADEYDRETQSGTSLITTPRYNLMPVNALIASVETAELWSAVITATQNMKQPRKTKTADIKPRDPQKRAYSYKYAPIEEITKVLKPALIPVGVWYQQGLVYKGPQAFIRTVVYHKSGQWAATDYPIFGELSAREFAGGVTMAGRRGLMLAFGITPEDDNEEALGDSSAHIRTPRTQPSRRPPSARESPPDFDRDTGEITTDLGSITDIKNLGFAARAWDEASKGREPFGTWYRALTDDERLLLRPIMNDLKKTAQAAKSDDKEGMNE